MEPQASAVGGVKRVRDGSQENPQKIRVLVDGSRHPSFTSPSSMVSTSSSSDGSTPVAGLKEDSSPEVIDLTMPEVRRSSRESKPTTIMVNGDAVKTQNNYVLKGLSYEYGAVTATAKPTKKQQPKKQQRKNNAVKTRKPTRIEKDRMACMQQIKKRVADKDPARKAYLARHVDILAPFVEPSVEASLRNSKSLGGTTAKQEESVMLQPDLIVAELRDYQLTGLEWMVQMHRSNLAMILGDEMGLGKTLQTIALFCHLKETERMTGPSLVICPLSVLYSWCSELSKWAPSLKFLRLHSSSTEEREAQKDALAQHFDSYDVVITTYEMAKAPSLAFFWRRQHFNYLVLDEGHIIKNKETLISEAVRKLHFENSLILTGTPLQNDLVELFCLLNFLYPDVFTTPQPFADAFCLGKKVINKEKLQAAHELLNLFMKRRLKEEVEKLMPPKIETKVICPLSKTQVFWYKGLLLKDIDQLVRASEKGEGTSVTCYNRLNNLLMQLRKCCDHPFLFDGAEINIEGTTCQDLVAASGKLSVLDMLLRSLCQKKHRVVLFSQFTSVLDILEDYCCMRGWKYCRFDGSTPRARRNFIVKRFNAPDSDIFIFLMSTRSGGMGLNLQSADTCVLFDSDFNPQPDLQAMARVHRIGQTKTVHVYRLVTGGTIEERIVERAQKKLYLDQMVNRGSVASSQEEGGGLTTSELLSTLKFGCNAVFGQADDGRNALPSEDDVDAITDRSRTENSSMGNLKGGASQSAADFDTFQEVTALEKFGGVDFKSIRDAREKKYKTVQGLAEEWAGLHGDKRRRKNRIVMVKGAGSGYGAAAVPVLASNNYELEAGESSVFDRELAGRAPAPQKKPKKKKPSFVNQDFCQICGDGGELLCCPNCPVCVHSDCVGVRQAKHFMSCPHHRCTICEKNFTNAGGILFPCQSCSRSYCDDCLPDDVHKLLGECERFEKLGYESTRKHCYIHCSRHCELYAKQELGWSPKTNEKQVCPSALDVSYAFGKRVEVAMTASQGGSSHATSSRDPSNHALDLSAA